MGKIKLDKKYPGIQRMRIYVVLGRAFSTREELISTFNKEQNEKR